MTNLNKIDLSHLKSPLENLPRRTNLIKENSQPNLRDINLSDLKSPPENLPNLSKVKLQTNLRYEATKAFVKETIEEGLHYDPSGIREALESANLDINDLKAKGILTTCLKEIISGMPVNDISSDLPTVCSELGITEENIKKDLLATAASKFLAETNTHDALKLLTKLSSQLGVSSDATDSILSSKEVLDTISRKTSACIYSITTTEAKTPYSELEEIVNSFPNKSQVLNTIRKAAQDYFIKHCILDIHNIGDEITANAVSKLLDHFNLARENFEKLNEKRIKEYNSYE